MNVNYLAYTALAVLGFFGSGVTCAAEDITKWMPRIERGQLIDPLTPRAVPATYPTISEERLKLSKDVSVGGTASPLSVNVRVSIPEKKK